MQITNTSALLSLLLLTAAPVAAEIGSRSLSVQQSTIASIEAGENASTIEVTATLNDDDTIYEMGEVIELSVRLSEPGYLLVYNTDSTGSMVILYPNQFAQSNFVPGDTDLIMPGKGAEIVAMGTPGIETLTVMATEEPVDVTELADFKQTSVFDVAPSGSASVFSEMLVTRSLGVVASAEVEAISDDGSVTVPVVKSATAMGMVTLSLETVLAGEEPKTRLHEPASFLTNLDLSSDRDSYSVGDEIHLTANADADCQLSLFAVGPTGNTTILSPKALLLAGGETQEIGPFRAEGPGGVETILAFCAGVGETQPAVAGEAQQLASLTQDVSLIDEAAPTPAVIADTMVHFTIAKP